MADLWNYTTIAPDPYYQVPGMTTPTYAIGTSGIPFGGFTAQNKSETYPSYSGQLGFSYSEPPPLATTQPVQPSTPQQYVYQAPQYTSTDVPQKQAQFAQTILDQLPDPQKINSYQFGKLKKSTQDVALAGYEAKGFDPNDVRQTIADILPKAIGQRRAYQAPLVSVA